MSTDRAAHCPAGERGPASGPVDERLAGLPGNVVIRQVYLGCLSQASYLVGDAVHGSGHRRRPPP